MPSEPSEASKPRIYTDFNDQTESDECWLLLYEDKDLSDQIETLGLAVGSRVILFQDGDDFEVEGVLSYGFIDMCDREMWFAKPDWSTLRYFT